MCYEGLAELKMCTEFVNSIPISGEWHRKKLDEQVVHPPTFGLVPLHRLCQEVQLALHHLRNSSRRIDSPCRKPGTHTQRLQSGHFKLLLVKVVTGPEASQQHPRYTAKSRAGEVVCRRNRLIFLDLVV